MSLQAYKDACARAELFGLPLPDKEEFISKNKHLDVVEFEEVEIKTAEDTAMLDEELRETSGGLTELNTILNSTQVKINKLKGVCGSLTNFFRVKLTAKDNLSYSSEPSYVGQTNFDKDYVPPADTHNASTLNEGLGPNDNEMQITSKTEKSSEEVGDINTALNDLEGMDKAENQSLFSKATVLDIGKHVTSQFSKLDQMIHQADKAETSLQEQNKQMRTFKR